MSGLIEQLNNPFQKNYPKWLFICSAGMLRSATAAHLFAGEGINTRCAGTEEYAVQPIHENTILWADYIFVMEQIHVGQLNKKFYPQPYIVLNIPDKYEYNSPELKDLLRKKIDEWRKQPKYPGR